MIASVKFWTDDNGATWRFQLNAQKSVGRETELHRASRPRNSLRQSISDALTIIDACDRHGPKVLAG